MLGHNKISGYLEVKMDYILNQLKHLLAIPSPTGYTSNAAAYIEDELRKLGYEPSVTNKGGIVVCIGGEGNPLMLSSHVDTLGGMVAEIKGNGRLRMVNIGGLNPNNAETENCVVHCRMSGKNYCGTLQMNNASVHVNKDYSKTSREFNQMEIVLDEKTSSADETKALGIMTGDFISFDPRTTITESGYIKSRFLDDKLSAAILLGYAKRVKETERKLVRKVYLYFTVYEEVGHGCAGAIPSDIEEIISVDMGCVGDGLACTECDVSICVKDSAGPYNYEVTTNLIRCANENNIGFAADIYPYYGSDADAALQAGHELKHGLIGPGVYASHGYERSHKEGVENTLRLIEAYTLLK